EEPSRAPSAAPVSAPAVMEAPVAVLPGGKIAPRTAGEKLLARIWEEVLGAGPVGAHDQFFEIGGHSLLSMKVIARVRAETGVRLSPRLLLLNTLEQIAPQLEQAVAKAGPASERTSSKPAPTLTP